MFQSSHLRSLTASSAVTALMCFAMGSAPVNAQTISFVQSSYAVPQTPQSTISVTYTAAQTAGDLNVVIVGWNDDVSRVLSVRDASGNVYALAVGPTVQPGIQTQAIYYAANIAAAAANANAVTVTFDRPTGFPDVRIAEYRGIAAVNPVDAAVGTSGTGGTSNSGTILTTNANDLLVAANYVQVLTSQGGTGFTTRLITSPDGNILQDRVVTATGSYSASASLNGNMGWVMQLVAFRAASASPSDTQPPAAPAGLTATAAAANQVNLTWPTSTDNVGVTGYLVERCQGAGCSNYVQVAAPSGASHSDTAGLASSTTYNYRVRAKDAVGNLSAYSTVATTTTLSTTPAAIAFIQSNYAVPQTPQSAVTVAYTSVQTAGNLNVVIVGWNDAVSRVVSVTDSRTNVYTSAVGPTVQAGIQSQVIYFAANIAPSAGSTNTVTVTFDRAVAYPDVRIAEYSGIATVNPVDAAAGASGTGGASNSGTIVTTNVNDLLIGANYVQATTAQGGAGFTQRLITSPDGNILEDRIVTTTGSYSATASLNGTMGWVMQIVAFRAAANGGAPSPTITGLNPSSGAIGTAVTIAGANFGAAQAGGTVTFSGIPAVPTSWSATTIVAAVPAGATTGNVVVTVGGRGSNGANFTVPSTVPTIATLIPTSGVAGTQVTITGSNFGPVQGGRSVTFNGIAATPTSWSNTSIVAPVPAGATTGNVVVTIGSRASNGVGFVVSTGTDTNIVYPLKASFNKRYLVDQNNVPVLLVGDTAHGLIGKLTESEAAEYFANRRANGFNSVQFYAPCGPRMRCSADGSTVDGIRPFTSGTPLETYDLATPNNAFFSRLDNLVNLAAAHGLTVLLDPIQTGDYLGTLRNNGPVKAFDYGVYLGTRYRNFANIIWLHGEDFQTWNTNSTENYLVVQVMAGIASVDSNHLQTIALNFYRSYSRQDILATPYLTMDFVYTYHDTYDYVLTAYNSSPTMPVFLGEGNYEHENNSGDLPGPADAHVLRRQVYWTLLSGGAGHYFGNRFVNHVYPEWRTELDTLAVSHMQHATRLFESYQWWNLVPDQTHQVVTAGYGSYTPDNRNMAASNYVTAAWVPDGTLAMAYCPTTTTLSVNLSQFVRPVTARWFDPSSGTFRSIAGAPFANSGTLGFTTPGPNSAGNSDWVLVLDATR
jgi:Protein of unknown function (DUF4038)/IPT/TIG domain/Putative collagen-binding domain of a collagenase